jgi:hypothetical protein
MKTRNYWTSTWIVMVFLAGGMCAWAQTATTIQKTIKAEVNGGEPGAVFTITTTGDPQAHVSTYTFVASEMGFESKVVKGNPFSADTVTEFTQVLGNGQRLYRNSAASLYRDSEGRTRREQTVGAIGPYASSGPAQKTIFINDPVAGVSYILNPTERAATKTIIHNPAGSTEAGMLTWVTEGAESGEVHVSSGKVVVGSAKTELSHISEATGGDSAGKIVHPATGLMHISEATGGSLAAKIAHPSNSRTEPLGTQMIEGVSAEGTRTIETIPAGAIGNETPIEIVSERWYSEELGMAVKTVRNDPLSGNNIYQLKNIRRGEPSPDLFQVPADYALQESVIKIQTIKK